MVSRNSSRFSRRISTGANPVSCLFRHLRSLFSSGATPFSLLLPGIGFSPLLAAEHLDAAKITELLLWTFAFITYVVLCFVIILRIRRSIKEPRLEINGYEGKPELFQNLYRKKLITEKEYQEIRRQIRDRLVHDMLNRPQPELRKRGAPQHEKSVADEDELDRILRLRTLLNTQNPAGQKRHR
ncbi:MAG: hypothetical protein ACOX6D_08525 [Thermoguttaceae bacterium]|jgi:hypothetical protein